MKCMICGGQTLPGAKLCLPCRAALRRARDDTISELLPLPRRREAFAFSHAPDIGPGTPLVAAAASVASHSRRTARRPARPTVAQLHAAAVVAFVAAAGVLTFITAREIQRERASPAPAIEAVAPAAGAQAAAPRVSPSTLLDSARGEGTPVAPALGPAAEVESDVPPVAPVPGRKPERSAKPKTVAKTPSAPEPPPAPQTAGPAIVAEVAPAPAAVPVVVRPVTPPDRGQLLATALGQCTGEFLSRIVCEHRARAQLCDGQWGQLPQCPAGIPNDHGQ